MGDILQTAVMHVMTPSLQWYDKEALGYVAKFADDYTGDMIDGHGQLRRGCIGLITHIPVDAFASPWWRERQYPLEGCIESLVQRGWLKRIVGEELDGALLLNTSRLVRMMDCEETSWAQNQHHIVYELDEHGNEIDPPCQDFADPMFLPFIRFADQLFPRDFESTLLNDVSSNAIQIADTCLIHDRDRTWLEDNPSRWTRAIHDWKEHATEGGFRVPAQWEVAA